MTDNIILMEPDEYDAYLADLEAKRASALAKLAEEAGEDQDGANSMEVSLYWMNQKLISGMPELTMEQRRAIGETLIPDWLSRYEDNYYMLLCKELSYYTVFHFDRPFEKEGQDFDRFWNEMQEVLDSVILIKVVEEDTNGAIAVWGEWLGDGEIHCFYLFPYSQGVVEV